MLLRITKNEDAEEILNKARILSEDRLRLMREIAKNFLDGQPNLIAGVNGSVARREMTSGSDVDLFFLTTDGDLGKAESAQIRYRTALEEAGIKMPSAGGVFEKPISTNDILSNIGGNKDTNDLLTRRMLFLLEGEWVHNQSEFTNLQNQLIEHYVTDNLEDRKICQYLLNDIIRYWRTICVDFEEKTTAGDKPRAIRLIKLRFSRMLLYFGGVAAISQTADRPAIEKRKTLIELLSKPPIERITESFHGEEVRNAINAYATFLGAIDSGDIRNKLDKQGSSGLDTDEYKELVEVARQFRDHLRKLLIHPETGEHRITSAILL